MIMLVVCKSSFSWAAVVAVLAILVMDKAVAQDEGACIMTNTSCPCAFRSSSGTCMRHVGGDYCLMGECNYGYKCDCLAYEKCKISNCAKYTTVANVIPSADNPFPCHLTPDAGECTDFVSFIDTIAATDYAQLEATQSVKTIDADVIVAEQDVISIVQDKITVEATLEQLNTYVNNVTEEERQEVEKDVNIVISSVTRAQTEATAIQIAMTEAAEASQNSALHRRVAYSKEAKAVETETELKIETDKPENKEQCNLCEILKQDIQRLRKERRDAAIKAGEWSVKTRNAKNRGRGHLQNIEVIKMTSAEARARCIARVEKILERLRAMNSPSNEPQGQALIV